MGITELDFTIAERIRESVELQGRLMDVDQLDPIARAARAITHSMREGHKLLVFGNGGSAADAQHIAAEFLGRFLLERRALPSIALADNSASVTAIGNDYGFDLVFARQIEGLCQPGDVAMAISTSGNSPNVLSGIETARAFGAVTIGLTGVHGGRLLDLCDICICFPSDQTPRIQEGHILIAHILCEIVEERLAGSGAAPAASAAASLTSEPFLAGS